MRQGIKIFGLTLLAALSLMAVTAVAAQAESGELLVETKAVTEGEEVPFTGTGSKGKLLVPGLELTIECEGGTASGTVTNRKIGTVKHLHARISILYSGCIVVGNKFCKVYPTEADRNAKTNAGHITATGLGLHKLVSLLNPPTHRLYLWIETLVVKEKVGEKEIEKRLPFTTVFFSKAAEGCTLPTAEITGTTAVILPEPSTNEEAVSHTLEPLGLEKGKALEEEESAAMANVQLFYGGEKASIDGGSATAKLSGAKFENKKWSLVK